MAPAAWGGEPPAEEPAPPAIEAPARWTIQLEPILWRPALLGDIQLPPGDRFDVELADLDENSLAPAGEATFRTGDDDGDLWFTFGGFHFGSDDDSTASGSFTAGGIDVDRGDRLSYDLDYSSFEGTVEYALPAIIDEPEDEVRWWFNVGAGARLYDLGLDFEVIGEGETSIDSTWIEPMGVARMVLELPYGFDIDTRMTLGGQPLGDDTSWSWDVTVGFIWSPHRNFAAEIGFRHLSVDRREGDGNDELIWDNALAGLWWSIVIRF
jgi:hypothetical protein